MSLLLEACALSHVYPDGSVGLDGCSLAIRSGSRNALLGSNGSGKTSLLLHFNALLQPTAGGVRFAGQPVKPVIGSVAGRRQQGEFNITATGIEGGLIYALSAPLRDALATEGRAALNLDLAPGKALERLTADLSRPRGRDSLANHLRRRAGIEGVKAGLLRELLPLETLTAADRLAAAIKHLPLPVTAMRPLDEAISTAGGVAFEALDDNLMLRDLPGVFCAGEMLDWEAPTGGYLLTACFATGRAAGAGARAWLAGKS